MTMDFEDPIEEGRYTIRQLLGMTGVEARRVYYYVQRGLIPKAEGSGPAARWTDDHAASLITIGFLKRKGMSLNDIRIFLQGHTAAEIYGLAGRHDIDPAFIRFRRFFHGAPREPGELARMEIVKGMDLYVSDKFLPRAAVRMHKIERALDEIFEFSDEEMKPMRRRAWSKKS